MEALVVAKSKRRVEDAFESDAPKALKRDKANIQRDRD